MSARESRYSDNVRGWGEQLASELSDYARQLRALGHDDLAKDVEDAQAIIVDIPDVLPEGGAR